MTLLRLIAHERARRGVAVAGGAAAAALGAAALLGGVFTLALGHQRWITRPSAPIGAWLVVTGMLALLLWRARVALRRVASTSQVASDVERERGLRSGSVRGALEVASSGALGRRAAEELALQLREGRGRSVLAPLVQRRHWIRGAAAVGAAIVALLLLGAAASVAPDGWRALRHPVSAWTGSLLAPLRIVNVPTDVMRGERLAVRISAADRREITLHLRVTGMPWQTRMVPVDRAIAATMIGPLDAGVALFATDGRMTSDTLTIRVNDRPFLGDVAIRASYPAYLGRAPEVLPTGEPARVPRGTVLTIRGRASTVLQKVALAGPSDTIRLQPDGHIFAGRVAAERSGRWSWQASGDGGPIADLPPPLELDVVADSAPRVELVAPARDTVVPADLQLLLRAAAVDDHGLSAITLWSWRRRSGGVALPEVAQSLATPVGPQWSGETTMDLASRGLEPGDELHLVVTATDDSPWRQTGSSRELVVRLPSLSEQRDIARTLADSTASRATAAAKAERQLAQRTGDAARSRGQRPGGATTSSGEPRASRDARDRSMSFQAAEQSKQLAQEQNALQEQIRQVQRDAKLLEKQLAAAGALDSSLLRQLREAQALLRDALTPEMQKLLSDVMQATQQLSREDVRRSLEQLMQQQQRLREQLEKSAEMLKRAALEGALATLRDEAKEVARGEHAVADSLQHGDSSATRAARGLGDRSRDLSRDIQQLSKRLEHERAEAGPRRLQSAAEGAHQSAQAMQRASGRKSGDEQRSGEPKAEQGGEPAPDTRSSDRVSAAEEGARQMEEAAKQLTDARDAQIQEWKSHLTGELDRSIQEMLQLGRQQEQLAQQARSGTEGGDLRGQQSAVQQGVEKVGERVQKAAQQSAHVSAQSQSAVGEARRRVEDATQRVAGSQGGQPGRQSGGSETSSAMHDAAEALNRAAAALVKDRERAAGGQSASGFAEMMQRMRDMAKEQGSLNGQSSGLLPMPGGQPSAQVGSQARQLGQRQRGLAERMEQLGQGDASGRQEAMAKEMRQIADALESGRIDPAVLDRQQRLFRRMLDAGLTLEKDERDDNGQRESHAAIGTNSVGTGTDASGRAAARFREPSWNELRGLSAEERRAVLEYFKRINAEHP
ncbi:MAG: hypothetical protein M3068_01080 [Gemmatimonadota bacterium]|nr:hypothetical protein [Gemmatimonadota bacterium]